MAIFTQPEYIGEVKEGNYFEYNHEASEINNAINYTLTGDVPIGLLVNSNGLIYGDISYFEDQPSCQDDVSPKEVPEFDGANYDKVGRYNPDFFDFEFYINAVSLEPASKKCVLRVRKDFGINGSIYLNDWYYYHGDKG